MNLQMGYIFLVNIEKQTVKTPEIIRNIEIHPNVNGEEVVLTIIGLGEIYSRTILLIEPGDYSEEFLKSYTFVGSVVWSDKIYFCYYSNDALR